MFKQRQRRQSDDEKTIENTEIECFLILFIKFRITIKLTIVFSPILIITIIIIKRLFLRNKNQALHTVNREKHSSGKENSQKS